MGTPATLGEYLKSARERAGLSQRQLANRVGIHYSYLSRLESGENGSPSAEVLQDIADLLAFIGVKPAEGLPELAPYLRAKYHLDDEQIRKATVYFRRSGWYLDQD